MIEAEHLTKYYGRVAAVQDVTFRVNRGEILGFLGPNGAGKTTTMRILTCYFPPSEGTARIGGYDVFEQSMEVRKRVGYLPEHPPLYDDMTVRSYLQFVAKIKGVDSKQRNGRISLALEKSGLEDVRDTIVGKLSKGYRQRVGLAQALVHDPEVLVLDEPTIGLDPKQIIEVRELIKALGGDHTVILSTHILPEVSMTCQRVVIISRGKVVAMDTPENLTTRLKGSERIVLQVRGKAGEIEKTIREIPDVTSVSMDSGGNGEIASFSVESQVGSDIRAELAARIVREGFDLLEMRPVGMSLEEIFLELTTDEEEV